MMSRQINFGYRKKGFASHIVLLICQRYSHFEKRRSEELCFKETCK